MKKTALEIIRETNLCALRVDTAPTPMWFLCDQYGRRFGRYDRLKIRECETALRDGFLVEVLRIEERGAVVYRATGLFDVQCEN